MDEQESETSPERPIRVADASDLKFLLESDLPPRAVLNVLAPDIELPPDADEATIARLLISLVDPPRRNKLTQFNTIEDAVQLIRKSNKIIVLSGAGISTSAGLPDFRSRNGIYKQIHEKHPNLSDPKCIFDIKFFRKNPQPFYHFARALFPGQYEPTVGHNFIKCLEEHGKLLNNYTQNIDTLEKQAGIRRVVECHGSFAKATCTNCRYSLDGEYIKKDIFSNKIPICPLCHSSDEGPNDGLGVMKPNIVFFGEQLGINFHDTLEADKDRVDLLIVIGSSLKVRPVALLPTLIPHEVPQILINREPLGHFNFDIELYGNCDEIIQELCHRLGDGWTKICLPGWKPLTELDASKQSPAFKLKTSSGLESVEECDGANVDTDRVRLSEIIDPLQEAGPKVPEGTFLFVKPNKYIFNGAEIASA